VRSADEVLIGVGRQRDRDDIADVECSHDGSLYRQRRLQFVAKLGVGAFGAALCE
jgi:hypothetical protein